MMTEQDLSQLTYFRLPDLLTVASEETEHAINGPAEFALDLTGVVVEYDDIVLCGNCNYPNSGDEYICVACEESLEGLDRMRFWKLVPNMQDVKLSLTELDLGPSTDE